MSIETLAGGSWFGGWNEPGVLQLLIVQSGVQGSGIFLYSGTPAAGNPPVLAAVAPGVTKDPYGNTIPTGLELSGLPLLVYSAAPAAGNLITSNAPTAGTDAFGNPFVQGFGAYATVGGNDFAMSIGLVGGNLALFAQNLTANVPTPPSVFVQGLTASAGNLIVVDSGVSKAGAARAQILVEDSQASALANGLILLLASQVTLGKAGAAFWSDVTNQLALPVASLVAAPSGTPETWHDMRPLSNSWVGTISGQYPPQYRIMADGFVEVFGYVQAPTTGNPNGVTIATLPAAYRPGSHSINWPVTMNQEPAATSAFTPRLEIDTSGNLQFHQCPSSGYAAAPIFSIAGRYPLNSSGLITS